MNEKESVASSPNIFLVPFEFVLAQQRSQLVLKTNLAVMFLLTGDVLLHSFEMDWLTEKSP